MEAWESIKKKSFRDALLNFQKFGEAKPLGSSGSASAFLVLEGLGKHKEKKLQGCFTKLPKW
ncbi:hypothetical protein C900_04038 [Fulvivirga imtechensis AK7]|uniref:Uncharacterized protein n=1 Tax=Fulvivirga imtechensis AK7 TaxID=1237149 RepID=L8JQ82_9BACT|nr:hypothetical protein C900_04038 [Fulvivirga imtechensis AK7]